MHSTAERPVLTSAAHAEQRQAFRRPLAIGLRCVALGKCPVTLIDISERGCQLQQPIPLGVGSYVVLYIPSFDPFGGTVMWAGAEGVGVQFAHPLHIAVVDHIVRAGGQQAAA